MLLKKLKAEGSSEMWVPMYRPCASASYETITWSILFWYGLETCGPL